MNEKEFDRRFMALNDKREAILEKLVDVQIDINELFMRHYPKVHKKQ